MADSEITQAEFDPTRLYIPLPRGWEAQTKGTGSSYRLYHAGTEDRRMILCNDGAETQAFVTRMFVDLHEADKEARARFNFQAEVIKSQVREIDRLHKVIADKNTIPWITPPAYTEADMASVRAVRDRYQVEAEGLRARVAALETELAWYGEQARLARLIHSEGDAGRHAIAADGGERARAALSGDHKPAGNSTDLQSRVAPWMQACFGPEISADTVERRHRFIEEALELLQAMGGTKQEATQLVDYVFSREKGTPHQEVGGVMITLAALCLAAGLDMHKAGEDELARIWTKVDAIRAKQAAKPKHSVLPIAAPPANEGPLPGALAELQRSIEFFQKVTSAPEAEKIAVGHDHWDRLLAAARAVVSALKVQPQSSGAVERPGDDATTFRALVSDLKASMAEIAELERHMRAGGPSDTDDLKQYAEIAEKAVEIASKWSEA